MVFDGKITQTGTSKKPGSKLSSRAFDVAKNADAATHIRLKDTGEFVQISDELIIKKLKKDENGNPIKDADGNPIFNQVHYTQINNEDEFVCFYNGKVSAIDGTFYVQVVFMKKNEEGKGQYYRCEDNVYIHKDEISIPAYKKVSLNENTQLVGPVRNGQFFLQTEEVILPDGKKIELPNDRVRKASEYEWQYLNDENEWIDCNFRKNIDDKKVQYVLLDNAKIVNVKKLKTNSNGDYVLKDIDGKDVVVGKKSVEMEHPFVMASTFDETEPRIELFVPKNLEKQLPRAEKGESLDFYWRVPHATGLVRLQLNANRTKAIYTYEDGHREIYVNQDIELGDLESTDVVHRVEKINVLSITEAGVEIEIDKPKMVIAEKVKFLDDKLNSFMVNNHKVTNIMWPETMRASLPTEYTIDGIRISNLEWNDGQVESCVIHLVDELGNPVEREITNLQTSEYRHLAVSYHFDKIEDLKTEGETISFKLGEYEFENAELIQTEEGIEIGKCLLKHKGVEEETDLSQDERFKQLRISVNIAIDEQRITPLLQSQLLSMDENGRYKVDADIIQTKKMEQTIDPKTKEVISGGVVEATEVTTLSQALREQEKFKQSPFTCEVLDSRDPNKTHTISDFKSTYDGSSEFDISNQILPNFIGKNKVEFKDGDIKIDDKKDKKFRDNSILLGFALCSNPFTLVFGVGFLAVGATYGVIAPMVRGTRKAVLKYRNPERIKRKIQDKAMKNCKENIQNMVKKACKEIEKSKDIYTQEEYEAKKKEIIKKLKVDYHQEIAKLQILGGGSMKCHFDPTRDMKLIPASHLEYLEYLRKRKIFRKGTQDSPRLHVEMKRQLEGLEGEQYILKKVELLEKYGGRRSQIEAYKLKLDNFETFLNKENKDRKLKGIEPEDFRKLMDRKFNEGKMKWGNMHDKIVAYKHSIEYLSASSKEKKELLKSKRNAFEKRAKEMCLYSVDFTESLDRKGNPKSESCSRSAMSYWQYLEPLLSAGETKLDKSFDFDFHDKLSAREKSLYTSNTLSGAIATKIDRRIGRRVRYDKWVSNSVVKGIRVEQQEISSSLEARNEEIERQTRSGNYEQLFETSVKLQIKEEQFQSDCADVESHLDNVVHSELSEDATGKIREDLLRARTQYTKQKITVEQSKDSLKEAYENRVRAWAMQEFAQTHKTEYEAYEQSLKKYGHAHSMEISDNFIQQQFYTLLTKKNPDKAQSYTNELETYKVKHNIEENIEAETFCEVCKNEYLEFIAERNANSTTGELDPASELARCYFYAHWKKENPLRIDTFKQCYAKKNIEKAKQRLAEGKLVKHERKIIRGKGAKKTAEATASVDTEQTVAPETRSEEAVLTA